MSKSLHYIWVNFNKWLISVNTNFSAQVDFFFFFFFSRHQPGTRKNDFLVQTSLFSTHKICSVERATASSLMAVPQTFPLWKTGSCSKPERHCPSGQRTTDVLQVCKAVISSQATAEHADFCRLKEERKSYIPSTSL